MGANVKERRFKLQVGFSFAAIALTAIFGRLVTVVLSNSRTAVHEQVHHVIWLTLVILVTSEADRPATLCAPAC